MLKKDLLFALIDELDDYCKNDFTELDMEGFLQYVQLKKMTTTSQTRKLGGDYAVIRDRDMPAEDLGKLIGMMGRYTKHYFKMAFEGSMLQSAEEFTFLMVLFTYESMLQTELIRKNAMEKNTGNEIIKRLMRMGLIVEAPKIHDKRAKPIAISDLGRTEIFKILPKMRTVGQVIGGNLSMEEKQMLIHLLSKLDHYHHELYEQKGLTDLEDYLYVG